MAWKHVIYFYLIELAKTEDALRPFVLACETKQIKLVTIAIGCIQKLISFHAIPEVKKRKQTTNRNRNLPFVRIDVYPNNLEDFD